MWHAAKNQLSDSQRIAAIGLNQGMLPVFLGLLFTASLAWLYLSNRLFADLRQNHPGLYERLGSPRLFMKKSFRTNFNVIRFVFKGDYAVEDDPAILRLCRGLRFLLYIYGVCLTGCMILFIDRFA